MRPGRPSKGEEGFTLIEVMISMLILLIGISGVLALQLTSMRATAYSRHTTEATVVAEDKMEELMAVPGALLTSGTDTVDAQGVDDVDGLFTRTWTVNQTGTISQLTVQVSWNEKGSEPHTITIATERRL